MQVKSIAVTDYSTGSQYKYTGTDGTWHSITAVGGTVNSSGSKGSAQEAAAAPAVTASSNSAPMPFQGTHRDSSSVAQPNAGGWSPTTLQTSSTAAATTYPGLPAGWTVTSSGKVLPPSAAPVSEPPPASFSIGQDSLLMMNPQVTSPPVSPTSSPAGSQQGSHVPGGYEVVTTYNEQGFPVVVTQPAGYASAIKHYNDQGFLVTSGAVLESRSAPTAAPKNAVGSGVRAAADSASPSVATVSPSATTGAASRLGGVGTTLTAVFGIFCGILLL